MGNKINAGIYIFNPAVLHRIEVWKSVDSGPYCKGVSLIDLHRKSPLQLSEKHFQLWLPVQTSTRLFFLATGWISASQKTFSLACKWHFWSFKFFVLTDRSQGFAFGFPETFKSAPPCLWWQHSWECSHCKMVAYFVSFVTPCAPASNCASKSWCGFRSRCCCRTKCRCWSWYSGSAWISVSFLKLSYLFCVGSRVKRSTIMDGARILSCCWVNSAIIGWESTVGKWVRHMLFCFALVKKSHFVDTRWGEYGSWERCAAVRWNCC